jgi:VCBS repeat-containing protein
MDANGSAEVVTIKISRKETVSGDTPERAASKERGGAGAATGTSRPIGKLVDPGGEMAASSFAQAALNAPRPSSSSYGIFMIAAFGALIYELDRTAHAAQAFDFGDGLADVFTSSPASDAKGLAAVAAPSFANFDGTPATAVYDGAFAFEFAQGDTITRDHSELHVGDADAEDNGSDRANTTPQGSGTINVVAAAANEGTRDTTQAGQDNEPNHGQWQPDLHDSDNGSGAAKGHIKHEAPGDDLNHGQSQTALHDSDNGSGAAKGYAKHEVPGDDLDTNKLQHDLQTASVKSANDAHSALKVKAEGKEGASSDDAGRAKSPVGTELGDSFHFKNGANNASSDILDLQQLGHGSGKAHEDGQHAAAHNGPVSVQDADAIDTSAAQHDHLGHSNHYAAHDLIV